MNREKGQYQSKGIASFAAMVPIVVFYPIGGLLLLLFLRLKTRKNKEAMKSKNTQQVYEQKTSYNPTIDVNVESDIVAIEDSLNISNTKYRRQVVLGLLKRENKEYATYLNQAINNDDPETVHYVASKILNDRIKLESDFKEALEAYQKNRENLQYAQNYLRLLEEGITMSDAGFYLKGVYYKSYYIDEIIRVLQSLVDPKVDLNESYISKLIKYLMSVGKHDSARRYVHLYQENYPLSKLKNMTLLEFYFETRDYSSFKHQLNMLLNHDFDLINEEINVINFWLKEN